MSAPDAALWRDLASFPGITVSIGAFPNARKFAPIIHWIRSMNELTESGWPACVGEQLDKVDRYYMVQSALPDGGIRQPSTLTFHGSFDATAVAECAAQALAAISAGTGLHAEVRTMGGLTAVRLDDRTFFIGWSRTGGETMAVVDDDERLVHDFLASPTKLDPRGELFILAQNIDRSGDMWSVGTIDYAWKLLETPSTGYDLSVRFSSEPHAVAGVAGRARLHFDAEASAAKAHGALSEYLGRITDEPTRAVLTNVLRGEASGQQLILEFTADREQTMYLMNQLAALTGTVVGASSKAK